MRALLILGAASALLGTTAAEHCTTWWTEDASVTNDPFYVDLFLCNIQCEQSVYAVVYEEANGLDGLQRGDPFVDTTCHGAVPSDRLLLQLGG